MDVLDIHHRQLHLGCQVCLSTWMRLVIMLGVKLFDRCFKPQTINCWKDLESSNIASVYSSVRFFLQDTWISMVASKNSTTLEHTFLESLQIISPPCSSMSFGCLALFRAYFVSSQRPSMLDVCNWWKPLAFRRFPNIKFHSMGTSMGYIQQKP